MRHRCTGFPCLAPLSVLLIPAFAGSASLRQQRSNDVVGRLERLLADVDESVRKSGEDEELVFSQLYEQDKRLEASLTHEIKSLNETRTKLSVLHAKYQAKANHTAQELQGFDRAANRSANAAGDFHNKTLHSGKSLEGLLSSVRHLMAVIRDAETSRTKALPHESVRAMQKLLKMHEDLRPKFSDVFVVFEEPPVQQMMVEPVLRPDMFGRTVSLLQKIHTRLRRKRQGAFLQVQSREQSLSAQTSKAAARADAVRSARVDGERKAEELAFSFAFAEAALISDQDFLAKVQNHIQAKAEFVESIRSSRRQQLTTLADLNDLLQGRYDAPAAELSFLQTSKPQQRGSSDLQTEIETALRNKGDTHSILLRIKAQLDQAAPIDAGNVHDVVAQMSSALHAIDSEQASADDARQKCEAQETKDKAAEQRLRGSLKLMAISQNHTKAAIQATKKNLAGIEAKARVLNKTAVDFASMASQAMQTFEGQSHDRTTILAAVQKAKDLAPRAVPSKTAPAAVAFFDQLAKLFRTQDAKERAYRSQQATQQQDLVDYTRSYELLLNDRRLHYDATLSSLSLYATELVGDQESRSGSLSEDAELQAEGQELCDSILKYYKRHDERRLQVSNALRAALPKLPEIMNDGSEDPDES